MANQLPGELDKAYQLAKKGDYDAALAVCNQFIEANAKRLAGYRERAAVLLHKGDVQTALQDLNKLVALNTKEPADYFDLGRTLLTIGQFSDAASAFSRALDLSSEFNSTYYVSTCRLLRAFANLESGNNSEAGMDLESLPDSAAFHIRGYGMISRKDLADRLALRSRQQV